MALSLHYLDGTDWIELDQDATGFALAKLQISYSHPAMFSFRLHVPQHTRPIPDRSLVYVMKDSTLLILGHVWEIIPTDANIVDYVIYDVTMRARNEITIMSGPHGDANVIPRRVDNVANDNDDDYSFENLHDATIGELIADYLTNAYNELFTNCQAAPLISGDPFVSSDLTPLDFIPQDKVVSESELLGQALERLLSRYPAYRILFEPDIDGTAPGNQWRFINIKDCPTLTLTLNDFGPSAKKVMSLQLKRIIDKRFTAFKIYGPQTITSTVAYVNDDSGTTSSDESGGLDELWSSGEAINFTLYGPGGIGTGDAGRKWQISDSTKRTIARIIPGGLFIDDSQYNIGGTSYMQRQVTGPTLQVTFDDGVTWWTATGLKWDQRTGIIETPFAMYQYDPTGSPSNPYKLPTNARLFYGYFGAPLEIRAPSSGYEGTAYTVAGMQIEKKEYDDMFAVGYEKGTPVTTVARTAQYAKLAQAKLDVYKDIIYTGGCTIDGIDLDFRLLQKRINFAGVDGSGGTITTGWESINAILTDVEYDFDGLGMTTLTFSSDAAQYLQQSTDELRQALKIRALQLISFLESNLNAAGGNISWDTIVKMLIIDPLTGQQAG